MQSVIRRSVWVDVDVMRSLGGPRSESEGKRVEGRDSKGRRTPVEAEAGQGRGGKKDA